MKASELPNPAKFIRGRLEGVSGVSAHAGAPKHLVVKTEPAPRPWGGAYWQREDDLLVTMLLHQDAYGPETLEFPVMVMRHGRKVKSGRVYERDREVWPLSDKARRYCTLRLSQAEYAALPLCTYKLMGRFLADIMEVQSE